MPSFMFYIIIVNGFILCCESKHEEHACIHDKVCIFIAYVILRIHTRMGVAIDARLLARTDILIS